MWSFPRSPLTYCANSALKYPTGQLASSVPLLASHCLPYHCHLGSKDSLYWLYPSFLLPEFSCQVISNFALTVIHWLSLSSLCQSSCNNNLLAVSCLISPMAWSDYIIQENTLLTSNSNVNSTKIIGMYTIECYLSFSAKWMQLMQQLCLVKKI